MKNKRTSQHFVESLKNSNGSYNFSEMTESNFLSTSFGTMITFLNNKNVRQDNNTTSYLKQGIIEDSRVIMDPKLEHEDLSGSHKVNYVQNQISYFSLIALDVLGIQLPEISIVDHILTNDESLIEWYNTLNLSQFWYESNRIMFMLYFLFYIEKYSNEEKKILATQKIKLLINLLNKSQDKNTGFWGTNLNGNNLYDGCYGAAHILLFYDYLNEEIPYKEKIIDNTLRLHTKNGLMKTKNGSACEDYDAIDIYLRCLNQSDYRKNDISDVLFKMKKTIVSSQFKSGGFPYKIAGNPGKSLLYNHILQREYTYSKMKSMKTSSFSPDLWATWFRLLSINVIDYLIEEKENYNSYWLPAWGYIK